MQAPINCIPQRWQRSKSEFMARLSKYSQFVRQNKSISSVDTEDLLTVISTPRTFLRVEKMKPRCTTVGISSHAKGTLYGLDKCCCIVNTWFWGLDYRSWCLPLSHQIWHKICRLIWKSWEQVHNMRFDKMFTKKILTPIPDGSLSSAKTTDKGMLREFWSSGLNARSQVSQIVSILVASSRKKLWSFQDFYNKLSTSPTHPL